MEGLILDKHEPMSSLLSSLLLGREIAVHAMHFDLGNQCYNYRHIE